MRRRDFLALAIAPAVKKADEYLTAAPVTITASRCPRSAGGLHDFYSEGDYWWPDPKNPNGPYIQRDGMSNPANFVAHRQALMRLSVEVPALTAAWLISGKQRYADHAHRHLRAWFVDEATRMNPNLQFAQAIQGRTTGRGTGIIDTIHLVEVARAAQHLHAGDEVRRWFADYSRWMMTHPNGKEERDARNNRGTCFAMQIAAFAQLTGDRALTDWARERYKTVLLPGQLAADGSFPLELKRTKPYGYSLFNLDAFSTLVQIVSTPADNVWTFELPGGRGMRKAVAYMEPFIRDKTKWPLPPDVMYYGEWPMRHCSLLFAGLVLQQPHYIELWKKLPAESKVDEVIRNFFIRQPVLWTGNIGASA